MTDIVEDEVEVYDEPDPAASASIAGSRPAPYQGGHPSKAAPIGSRQPMAPRTPPTSATMIKQQVQMAVRDDGRHPPAHRCRHAGGLE